MRRPDYFDVLSIKNEKEKVDMIQSLLGKVCLGTHFQNGDAKLYFEGGIKNDLETRLQEIKLSIPFQWKWEQQNRENWQLAWQDNFKPVVIDEKLAVVPYWKNEYPADIKIIIKPGMAFGTGHHESTWLILKQMIKQVKPGMSVLDLGTGSGILSIAAVKLGAEKVDAFESDKECETNFKQNLKLNKMEKTIQFHLQDVLTLNEMDYDLIVANINRKIVEQLIPQFKHCKGKMIISGFLDIDEKRILEKCTQFGLKFIEKNKKGEWLCLTLSAV